MSALLLIWRRFLNLILILFLITPAVASFWRGTWYILDLFVFTDDEVLSAQVTFTASFGIIFLIMLVEDYLKESINERKSRRGIYLVLFYPLAFLVVTSWRGLWMMLDLYTTTSLTSACISHAVGFLILLSTKASSNIIAIPGYCISERHIHDLSQSILVTKQCLQNKTSACGDITSRMVNSFVTVIIIGAAVISYWRGTWLIILTTMRHPHSSFISSIVLASLGYGIVTMCYCLSEFTSTLQVNSPHSFMSRAMEQLFVYILGFGVVASWFGIWHLMDLFLLPDQPVPSALVSHFVGIVGVYLLQASVNLIGSPAGCSVHDNETLKGFDMGSYLAKITTEPNKPQENSKAEP